MDPQPAKEKEQAENQQPGEQENVPQENAPDNNIQNSSLSVQPDDQGDWEDCNDDEEQQEHQEEEKVSVEKIEQIVADLTDGCQHYRRNCLVEAPCCRIFYGCKICHDEQYQGPKSETCKVERMQFSKVQKIKCLKCQKIQEPAIKCQNPECEVTFGQYACLKCKLYENLPSKVNDIFHCDDCEMCRRGKREDYFHCSMCGYCRPMFQKNNHKCSENVAEGQCPICLQVLKFSTKFYSALPCGHLIHVKCLSSYAGINCPICGMALQKVSDQQNKHIERLIAETQSNMPEQLRDKKVDILCNECLHKSKDRPFHFFGIKCEACGTYNTKMI